MPYLFLLLLSATSQAAGIYSAADCRSLLHKMSYNSLPEECHEMVRAEKGAGPAKNFEEEFETGGDSAKSQEAERLNSVTTQCQTLVKVVALPNLPAVCYPVLQNELAKYQKNGLNPSDDKANALIRNSLIGPSPGSADYCHKTTDSQASFDTCMEAASGAVQTASKKAKKSSMDFGARPDPSGMEFGSHFNPDEMEFVPKGSTAK